MKERSRGTPLIDMLKGYQPCRGRFHMPGHKASPDFCRTFPGAAWDITELPFSDDLLDEKGCIAEAEELASAAFCGEFCLFLTGGTTLAVQIMVGMAARRGPLLLPRASHRSAFAACDLFGAEPVVLEAEECTSEQPSQQEEISRTVSLNNENFPQVQIQLYRYDGSSCLAVVDGEPVSLVLRSDAVDLMEAVRAIVLN